MEPRTVYFISGLGADQRSFKFLKLKNAKMHFIYWLKPEKGEPLKSYCLRLASQIDTSNEVILVGLSFGGIVAQEIAQIIKVDKLMIISSIKSSTEFNWQLKLVRFLKLYRITPSRFLKWSNLVTGNYYFSVESVEESKLLKQIIQDTDRYFMKWAIGEIMKWPNPVPYKSIIHIHGSRDRIFPVGNIENYYELRNAGHFMIVNRAAEISEMLNRNLEN
jgi:pimeloyl-ACP methyl ester carboxylesterase